MARREEPIQAHLPKPSAEAPARGPQAPAPEERSLGAGAQLAAVHRILRHGPALQLEAGGAAAGGQSAGSTRAAGANRTGLPDRLKSGVEALSGVALDDVRVHYNSAKPAQLQALAYTQGTDIHVAPGQERHLPHEAWHVVQQKEGRVKPTRQMKGVGVNDQPQLEAEADAMGARALQTSPHAAALDRGTPAVPVTQLYWLKDDDGQIDWIDGICGPPLLESKKVQAEKDGHPAGSIWTLPKQQKMEASASSDKFTISFGAKHGDLHFIKHPTENKSAWKIDKGDALKLMEDEIKGRMKDIVAAAAKASPKVLAWILVADATYKIGSTVKTASVKRFQIQLQASLADKMISYHGFPDDQAQHTGLGPSRNNLT